MKKNLLILMNQELDERNLERLGINFFLNRKWKIFILNYYKNKNKNKKNLIFLNNKNIYTTIKQLIKSSKNINYYLNFSGASFKEKIIQIVCKNLKIKKIDFDVGNIPKPYKINRLVILNHFFSKDFFKTIVFIISNLKNYILKYFDVNSDIKFISGSLYSNYNGKIIFNHNFDYDIFLKEKNILSKKKNKYFVFLDQNFENSFDLKEGKYLFKYNKKKYWLDLVKFFYKIKSNFGYDIKVLAHPRRDNKKYLGIKFIKNKSFKLIKNALGVFAHDSTAIQISVLLNKPIIFLTSDYINNDIYRKNSIKAFSKELGSKLINLNSYKLSNLKFDINKKLYKRYIDKFIKHKKSKKIITWEKLYNLIN